MNNPSISTIIRRWLQAIFTIVFPVNICEIDDGPLVVENNQAQRRRVGRDNDYEYIPDRYHPDLQDPYRPTHLDDADFHQIGKCTIQASRIIAAKTKILDGQWGRVVLKKYEIEVVRQKYALTLLISELRATVFRHPNIIETFEYFYHGPVSDPTSVWLTTFRMDCTLDFYFNELSANDRAVPTKRKLGNVALLLYQLLRALDFLWERRIMHRDVTPKNIGFNKQGFQVRLLDFGGSGKCDPATTVSREVATPWTYRPVEMLREHSYNMSVDTWAAALVIVEMLGEKLMCPRRFRNTQYRDDKRDYVDRIHDVLGNFDDALKEPLGRLSLDERQYSVGDFKSLLQRMLAESPEKRPYPSELLDSVFFTALKQRNTNPLGQAELSDFLHQNGHRIDEKRMKELPACPSSQEELTSILKLTKSSKNS